MLQDIPRSFCFLAAVAAVLLYHKARERGEDGLSAIAATYQEFYKSVSCDGIPLPINIEGMDLFCRMNSHLNIIIDLYTIWDGTIRTTTVFVIGEVKAKIHSFLIFR